ncbi:hypothetical protein [Sphingobacterium sp. DR205]|uniref:hypothetical protein n=1 Tax=Sphingobacterium sp. DR205 TaxID=2713573 RepID=UPI0013E4B295|nr:hypothetical protein [Sphingobacterium sp. DR205]QIH31383.1 hypothetical protein G6053_29635 [Sphingobacterium sp. DR205]
MSFLRIMVQLKKGLQYRTTIGQICYSFIILLLIACSPSQNSNKLGKTDSSLRTDSITGDKSLEAGSDHQLAAERALTELLAHWGTNIGKMAYPDYYGGAYVSENGQLTVYIKQDNEQIKQEVIGIAGTKDIAFKCFDYTYLTELMGRLNDFVRSKKDPKLIENISTFSLLEKENKIEVGLLDCSPEKIGEFRKSVLDSPVLSFKESGKVQLE